VAIVGEAVGAVNLWGLRRALSWARMLPPVLNPKGSWLRPLQDLPTGEEDWNNQRAGRCEYLFLAR
jgi:hypothetical protein